MYKLTGSEKCTEAEMNDHVTVPSKVCPAQVATKILEWPAQVCTEGRINCHINVPSILFAPSEHWIFKHLG